MTLISRSSVRVGDAPLVLSRLAAHFRRHRETLAADAACLRLSSASGTALVEIAGDRLELTVDAATGTALADLQYLLATHVGPLAEVDDPQVLWRGDGAEIPALPDFRVLRVEDNTRIGPRMRRLVFSGSDLARFDTLDALHGKLLLPAPDTEPKWPELGRDGKIDWGPAQRRPHIRKYTIRDVDPSRSLMSIDFALHGANGPGSLFAMTAAPGAEIGLFGPGGGSAPAARHNLFVGDHTALPAIARLLAAYPADARGLALIEVEDEEDVQSLRVPEGFELRWLFRKGRPSALAEQAEGLATLPESSGTFAWAGCEFDTFLRIRRDWRTRHRLPRDSHLAVAYWRRGHAQK